MDENKERTIRRDLSIDSMKDMIRENFGDEAARCVPQVLLQTLVESIASGSSRREEVSCENKCRKKTTSSGNKNNNHEVQ